MRSLALVITGRASAAVVTADGSELVAARGFRKRQRRKTHLHAITRVTEAGGVSLEMLKA